ncbi:hypothetical protein CTEN210_12155 [Chaetoceros tenuissimus]|uniref:RNA-dependent RNA polymerase n=1 Tax=Chaetoceros tenuissimus TaxID=426638 RepID=A0AAD3D410_9STRA|nr:hypothetical protein CTEN210_12155 [Chaetoceros tenuissimus]
MPQSSTKSELATAKSKRTRGQFLKKLSSRLSLPRLNKRKKKTANETIHKHSSHKRTFNQVHIVQDESNDVPSALLSIVSSSSIQSLPLSKKDDVNGKCIQEVSDDEEPEDMSTGNIDDQDSECCKLEVEASVSISSEDIGNNFDEDTEQVVNDEDSAKDESTLISRQSEHLEVESIESNESEGEMNENLQHDNFKGETAVETQALLPHHSCDNLDDSKLTKSKVDHLYEVEIDLQDTQLREGDQVRVIKGKYDYIAVGVIDSFTTSGKSARIAVNGNKKNLETVLIRQMKKIKTGENINTKQVDETLEQTTTVKYKSAFDNDVKASGKDHLQNNSCELKNMFDIGDFVEVVNKAKTGHIQSFTKSRKSARIKFKGEEEEQKVVLLRMLRKISSNEDDSGDENSLDHNSNNDKSIGTGNHGTIDTVGANEVGDSHGISKSKYNPPHLTSSSLHCPNTVDSYSVGDMVRKIRGVDEGSIGHIISFTDSGKSARVQIRNGAKKTILLKLLKLLDDDGISVDCDNSNSSPPVTDFLLPDSEKGGIIIGNRRVTRMMSEELASAFENNSIMEHILGGRKLTKLDNFERTLEVSGSTFELLCTKVVDSNNSGKFLFHKKQNVQGLFMQTSGPDVQNISISNTLSRLAAFERLNPRKVVARLELLQSPAAKNKSSGFSMLSHHDLSIFEEIAEKGYDGCGFICENLLAQLLGSDASTKNAICIQVRILIPRLGLFKGMLMSKKIDPDIIAKIQLPSSMKKVPASFDPNASNSSCLLITQAGIDPSLTNKNVPRIFEAQKQSKDIPAYLVPKELSPMIKRLFKSLNVPPRITDCYVKKSTTSKTSGVIKSTSLELNHCTLRGVADPTSRIPPNTVFISGMEQMESFPNTIFITRFPCVKASDGRLVEVMRSKPDDMTESDYNWLQSLPLGIVIFGLPRNECLTIPQQIANGDLDGDRYLICWDSTILEYIRAEKIIDVIDGGKEHDEGSEMEYEYNENWFSKAQSLMMDANTTLLVQQLIGKLYKLSERYADNDKVDFMNNKDAIAFADAYYQALENGKHGTKITLPKHLWEKVPKKFHCCLTEDQKSRSF